MMIRMIRIRRSIAGIRNHGKISESEAPGDGSAGMRSFACPGFGEGRWLLLPPLFPEFGVSEVSGVGSGSGVR